MGYMVGKGYSPTFRDEVFSEIHIQNPARIPDRPMHLGPGDDRVRIHARPGALQD